MAGALNILLTICLLHGVLSADFQIFLPETIEAVAGSCVTIPCSFEIQDKYNTNLDNTCVAIWKKGDHNPASDVTSRFTTTATAADLKNKICTSTINNIQIADAGTYFFRLECKNPLMYNFPSGVNINVKADPPKLTLSPSELEVEEGASVSLQCSAPAPCPSLRPTVTWTPRLGTSQETLVENQDKTKVIKSVLNFTASHLHHGRRFKCTAVYRRQDNRNVSSVSKGLKAHVKYRPKNTTVLVSPSGPVQEGTDVVLKCSSDANPAVQIYTWYRADPQHETRIHTGPDLTITAARNTGAFLCQAENDLGTGRSNKTNIDVQYVPKDTKVLVSPSGPVQEGTNVVLKCSSDANPAVQIYTWYRADPQHETLIHTGPDLTITAARNTGAFLCQAENNLGTGRSNKTNIDVRHVPKDTKVLVSPSGPVHEGTNVVLKCSSDANPAVQIYTWYRADPQHETRIHTGPDLTITASRNTGAFLCQAENNLGTGRSNRTDIDVQFAPQILSSSNCTKAAATVSCSCSTVGNPSPRLQWYLDGLSVNHSDKVDISSESLNGTGLRSTITVNLPQKLDLSTLFCHSRNSVGSTFGQFYFYTFEHQTPVVGQGQGMFPALITTVGVLLILVCVLLFVIRTLKTHPTHPSTVTTNQLLDGNDEVPSATERNIYANTNVLSQEHETTPGDTNSLSDNAEGGKSSENKQGGGEVIYSSVIWKSKKEKKKEDRDDARPSCSYLEEERCMMGDVCKDFVSNAVDMGNQYDDREHKTAKKEVECEYAQVKYKVKSTNNQ
ncbi:B-cell receptor CD22-like isoform X2 [Sphaeramia orbicularis]|uniref:B-cell receptor CD22-like isoform X2 n=1 Tax=Sphaeramia orbicularis TaxID=375764 RepID=UPI00117C9A6A|nr:B-cell receptor CD22-like isoform X2 [Sphaeramia orbicularis]